MIYRATKKFRLDHRLEKDLFIEFEEGEIVFIEGDLITKGNGYEVTNDKWRIALRVGWLIPLR